MEGCFCPLIKTPNNNDFYILIRFNSYRKKADKKRKCAHKRKHNTPFCNNFGSEVSAIFSRPSPFPNYSKIIPRKQECSPTSVSRKTVFFEIRNVKWVTHRGRKFFLLPKKWFWPSRKNLFSQFLVNNLYYPSKTD